MCDSHSDCSDDSYYDRLYEAVCAEPDRDSRRCDEEIPDVGEDHQADDYYFERLQSFGELESTLVLPEDDVVWNLVKNALQNTEDGPPERVMVAGSNFTDITNKPKLFTSAGGGNDV
jgi:hypothetical protein